MVEKLITARAHTELEEWRGLEGSRDLESRDLQFAFGARCPSRSLRLLQWRQPTACADGRRGHGHATVLRYECDDATRRWWRRENRCNNYRIMWRRPRDLIEIVTTNHVIYGNETIISDTNCINLNAFVPHHFWAPQELKRPPIRDPRSGDNEETEEESVAINFPLSILSSVRMNSFVQSRRRRTQNGE